MGRWPPRKIQLEEKFDVKLGAMKATKEGVSFMMKAHQRKLDKQSSPEEIGQTIGGHRKLVAAIDRHPKHDTTSNGN